MVKLEKIFLIFLGVFILLIGPYACSKEEKAPKVPLARKAISVKTVDATSLTLPEFKAFPGKVVPKVQVRLAAKAPGYVKEVLVQEGDKVKKGQVLIHLDDKDIHWKIKGLKENKKALLRERAAMAQDYSYAKKNFERIESLYKEEAATKDEYDRARALFLASQERLKAYDAQVQGIDAQINALKNELTYRVIKSPTTGWVTKRLVDPGTFVGPGMQLFEITSKSEGFWFVASIPESLLNRVHPNDTAYVMVQHRPSSGLTPTKISKVIPEVDPVTRTFKIKAAIEDTGYRSGMYGTIWLQTTKRTGILLPGSLVISRGGIKGVYAANFDDTIYFQVITTGGCYYRLDGRLIPCDESITGPMPQGFQRLFLITSGISPGMKICASRLQEIREGMSLE